MLDNVRNPEVAIYHFAFASSIAFISAVAHFTALKLFSWKAGSIIAGWLFSL